MNNINNKYKINNLELHNLNKIYLTTFNKLIN